MIDIATFAWITVGAYILYLVAQDGNVYEWIFLQSKSLRIWLVRQWFRIRYNPDSPWVRYEIERNARRIAEEIIKENKSR